MARFAADFLTPKRPPGKARTKGDEGDEGHAHPPTNGDENRREEKIGLKMKKITKKRGINSK